MQSPSNPKQLSWILLGGGVVWALGVFADLIQVWQVLPGIFGQPIALWSFFMVLSTGTAMWLVWRPQEEDEDDSLDEFYDKIEDDKKISLRAGRLSEFYTSIAHNVHDLTTMKSEDAEHFPNIVKDVDDNLDAYLALHAKELLPEDVYSTYMSELARQRELGIQSLAIYIALSSYLQGKIEEEIEKEKTKAGSR